MAITIRDYVTPDFLSEEDEDTIYERMKAVDVGNNQTAADVVDRSQGYMFWDACRPSAIEKASLAQQTLNEVIKAAFPQYANDDDLDNHGQVYNVERNAAVSATVTLTITGTSGTVVEKGFLFSTPSTEDTAGIEFETDEEVTIPSSGTITVAATAVVAGTTGNVAAGLISLLVDSNDGITSVNNASAAINGIDEEEDDDYRQRILEEMAKNPGSGSKSDYIKWAKEVDGVGAAYCIPEWQGKGTGTVKVIVLDSNGDPASDTLIAAVLLYITGENGDDGVAPVGAIVTVVAPDLLQLAFQATVTIEDTADIDTIVSDFETAMKSYYETAMDDELIRYNRITTILMSVDGVVDYSSLIITIIDTVASYTAETGAVVLTNGYDGIGSGDTISIDGTSYTISSYDTDTKTAVLSSGPASITSTSIAITVDGGTEDLPITVAAYPTTTSATFTTA